jgi:response regulator of citrate/malate metabolism
MMTRKKPNFNSKQRAILQLLNKSRAGFTLYEISQRTGIAWVTARKYIHQLVKKGVVIPNPIQTKNEIAA